jgi:hypothetical protein
VYGSEQSPGQLMPGPVTVPVPLVATVSVGFGGGATAAKAAETEVAPLTVTLQDAVVPVHDPPQPLNV